MEAYKTAEGKMVYLKSNSITSVSEVDAETSRAICEGVAFDLRGSAEDVVAGILKNTGALTSQDTGAPAA